MNKVWYVIGAVVVIALAFWYLYPLNSPMDTVPSDTVVQTQTQAQTTPTQAENTTAEISAEFEQIVDDTAELNQAAAASAQDVQGL